MQINGRRFSEHSPMDFYKATYSDNHVVSIELVGDATGEEVILGEGGILVSAIVKGYDLMDAEVKARKLGFRQNIDAARMVGHTLGS